MKTTRDQIREHEEYKVGLGFSAIAWAIGAFCALVFALMGAGLIVPIRSSILAGWFAAAIGWAIIGLSTIKIGEMRAILSLLTDEIRRISNATTSR